jgi:type II restriction enzyme
MAVYSFVQSINTTLGTSVFEQIAAVIARPHFKRVVHQFKEFNNTISADAQRVIQEIMDDLTTARATPDKAAETARVLAVAQSGTIRTVKRPRIDLFVESFDDIEHYFDLKTAKPNMGDFLKFKRPLLEWVTICGERRVCVSTFGRC